ncbi:MAG TPA: hypothetical protein VMM15_04130 [Bradyrhizobium sp.]|nr:hypothetical protein [Bradyrhizobium sp.]
MADAALVWIGLCCTAHAESCSRSVDYILNDIAGALPRQGQEYQALLRTCLQTLQLSNVKDAYVLRDGGIAVTTRDARTLATANTLAQFCRKFPTATLRFISPKEMRRGLTTGLVVMMASADLDSCRVITGQQQRF